MYYVYFLFDDNNKKTYVGFTKNVEKRLNKHSISSKQRYNLVHLEKYEKENIARDRERFLKTSQGRKVLHNILNSLSINIAR